MQLSGDGPERQVERTTEFATRAKDTVINTFVDDVTGSKDTADRPAWNAMLKFCKETGCRKILIEKIDRLQREPIVGEILLAQCREIGIAVIDCSTGMNFADESEDPYVRFLQRILRDAAAFNKDVMIYHTGKARAKIRAEKGKCEGAKGYHDSPDFPQGQAIIERAKALRESGLPYRKIARILNSEGLPTMTGRPWRGTTVHKMLKRFKISLPQHTAKKQANTTSNHNKGDLQPKNFRAACERRGIQLAGDQFKLSDGRLVSPTGLTRRAQLASLIRADQTPQHQQQ